MQQMQQQQQQQQQQPQQQPQQPQQAWQPSPWGMSWNNQGQWQWPYMQNPYPYMQPAGATQTGPPAVTPPLPPTPTPTPPPPLPIGEDLSEVTSEVSGTTSDVLSVATTSGQAEGEDPVDIMKAVISDTSYEERIEMVGDILGAELPTTIKRSANFAMSVSKKAGTVYSRLPPSERFADKFDEFTSEISGSEGSCRSSNPKNRQPLAIHKLPNRPRPKMQFYEICGCPWQISAPKC